MKKNFTRLRSEKIFDDGFIGLRIDDVRAPDNVLLRRKVLTYQPASALVALDHAQRILLIHHYRYPINRSIWELPGGIDEGADAEHSVVRELAEEAGFFVTEVEHLLTYAPEPAFSSQFIKLFLATGLEPAPKAKLSESEIADTKLVPIAEALEMIRQGEIQSSWTIIGVLLAARRLLNNTPSLPNQVQIWYSNSRSKEEAWEDDAVRRSKTGKSGLIGVWNQIRFES